MQSSLALLQLAAAALCFDCFCSCGGVGYCDGAAGGMSTSIVAESVVVDGWAAIKLWRSAESCNASVARSVGDQRLFILNIAMIKHMFELTAEGIKCQVPR